MIVKYFGLTFLRWNTDFGTLSSLTVVQEEEEEEPSCFLTERFFYEIFKMIFLINFYTLQQGNLCVIDYAKKEIFFKWNT